MPSSRCWQAATLLFSDGDKMAADVQKFVDAAENTPFEQAAGALLSKVLLVRVANWRMLATRDGKGFATFKTNVGKAQQQIAQLEKADLPSELAALLSGPSPAWPSMPRPSRRPDPTSCSATSFTTRASRRRSSSATEKMDKTHGCDPRRVRKIRTRRPNERIAATITMQEAVAGAAIILGLLIAFLIARGIILPLRA